MGKSAGMQNNRQGAKDGEGSKRHLETAKRNDRGFRKEAEGSERTVHDDPCAFLLHSQSERLFPASHWALQ